MSNLTDLILPKADAAKDRFRLGFNSVAPVQEVVLARRGLLGNVLIRGEDYGGRTKAVSELCGDAALSGFGVIYVTDGMGAALASPLRDKAHRAFGAGKYYALHIDAEPGCKFKVSRHGVSVLQFNSAAAPSSADRIRARMPSIIEWIVNSNTDAPLLLALENYHLYANDFVLDMLDEAYTVNCAVLLTTLGSDPRGDTPPIHPKVYEKCGIVVDLNRRWPQAASQP